jgi:hypothetical protein
MARVPIKLVEGDEPLLTFFARRTVDGAQTPINITGATVQFVKKADVYATDASGTTIAGVITNAANGEFTVQITSAVTSAPGAYFYKAQVIQSAKPLTIRYGDLVIDNA